MTIHPSSTEFVRSRREAEVAVLELARPPVNALTLRVVEELSVTVRQELERGASGLVLTGSGAFFSFGFDVPWVRTLDRTAYGEFLAAFCALYRQLFTAPVPVIAALNGHAPAGGCMLALAADRRLLVAGRSRMGLNEIGFGSTVFAGSAEMLVSLVGRRSASEVLYSGSLFRPQEALALGLVEELQPASDLLPRAIACARRWAGSLPAFRSMKSMLRDSVARRMEAGEAASIEEFLDIWYSPATQAQVAEIEIRS